MNVKNNANITKIIKKITILIFILTISLGLSSYMKEWIQNEYYLFLQIAQVIVIGYIIIEILGNGIYNIVAHNSKETADIIKILIKIVGALIIISVIISYLTQNPIIATSIGTISAIVVGFASQNIIGNVIAGLYIAITRPFKIGDKITIFDKTGIIYDIGLLNSKLSNKDESIVIIPNLSIVTATIILHRD
ncbi:MAG: hypothetical protein DA328_00775 [Nitrososphaeraceae archaeon]|nr:hypothetical protein [Nitrososphaeraceae archaeon]